MITREFEKPIKAAGVFAILAFLPSAIGVFMLPIYLQHLKPSEYGTLALMAFFAGFYSIVSCLQLNAAAGINYFNYSNSLWRGKYISSIFTAVVLLSFLSYLVFILIGVFFFQYFLESSTSHFFPEGVIVLTTAFLNQVCSIYFVFLKNEYQLKIFASYILAFVFFNLIFQYFFIVIQDLGVFGSIFGSFLARIIVSVYLVIKQQKLFDFRPNKKILEESLRFSLPLIPIVFINWFFTTGDRLFLERFMDLTEVGKYALLMGLLLIANQAFTALWSAFTPRLLICFGNLDNYNISVSQHLINWHIKIGLVVLVGTIMVGSNLSIITDNEKYISIAPLFSLGAVVMLPKMIQSIPTLLLMHAKQSVIILWCMLISMIVMMVGFFTLIPLFGIEGALFSLGMSNTTNLILQSFLSRRYSMLRVQIMRNGVLILVVVCMVVIPYILFKKDYFSLENYGVLTFSLVFFFLLLSSYKEILGGIRLLNSSKES